ncbi:MAG TPA: hypothetical protein VJP78_08355 [Thermoleophilia bacterium]|nr:hypothetical protein [Thermoleophilia bacterium]
MKGRTSRNQDGGGDQTSGPGFKLSLFAVLLISFSVLTFEVALTRIFSVILSYHFVFAIVSSAMLGLGLGGVIFRRWGRRVPGRAIWIGSVVFSLSLAASLLLVLAIPAGGSKGLSGLRLLVYLVPAVVPFGAAGFVISGLFQRFSGRSSLLYGADLIGAAGGALAVVPGMNLMGPVNLVFLAVVVAAVGALLLGLPRLRRALPAIAIVAIVAGSLGALIAGGIDLVVPVTADPNKDMVAMLSDPGGGFRISESRWSSFGRTDLVESPLYPMQKYLFVDGAAGSAMYNLESVLRDPQAQDQLTMHSGESFPFQFLKEDEKRTALILGPGGGQDVVTAILGGVKDITAVEVNPDVVEFVRQYKDFSGGIYSGRPGVTAVVAEGRNYVRTSAKKFDLIMAAIPVTKSSRSVEGYALTENNLFTVEAFKDYLDHLTSNGRIIIVAHNNHEIYRLVTLALGAFGKQGISEPAAMNRLYTVGSDTMPTLVVQKQPLSVGDANAIHEQLHAQGLDKNALFIPSTRQQLAVTGLGNFGSVASMLDPRLFEVSQGTPSARVFARETTIDLRPTTDDRPFFYKNSPGLPSPFPIFAVLLIVFVAGLGALLAMPRKRGGAPRTFVGALRASGRLKTYLALFFALGLAYMLIEIAFFQKLALYISQPQMALSILLFSLLLGGGIGSLLTTFLKRRRLHGAAVIAVGVAIVVPLLTSLFSGAFGLGLDPRLAAALLILPLGILMGCPFPLAMASFGKDGFEAHTAVMWGVNGGVSVLGSALAMIIGISWGFSRALLVGAVLYLVIGALFVLLARNRGETNLAADRSPA